jgi:transcriptional regulator with PAS, ATPase and Fis domain
MKKIAYLAPDAEKLDHIKALLAGHHDELEFAVGSLKAGVKKAKELIDGGVDIIIARGETAYNIRDAFPEVIVVVVPITGFDLAMALEKSRQYGSPVAVVSFASMIRRIEQLETPLGVKILKCELPPSPSPAIINREIDRALAAGAQVILGGFTPFKAAQERAIPYVSIPTSDEAYVETFHHARSLLQSIEQERGKSGFIKGVLGYAYEGIVSIDKTGAIRLINAAAQRILNYHPEKAKKKRIMELCPEMELQSVLDSGKEERDRIYRIKGTQVLCNKVPILSRNCIIGAVATFQEIDRIRNMESRIRKEIYAKGHVARYNFDMIRAVDKKTKELLLLAGNIADADANVVILGETGTGKEVFAQSIHRASRRCNGPFVAVNCAALPASLLESELFGYVEGAFTGAKKEGKQGFFELAHGGTLFLDEIAEMDYGLQSRLLRALQERAVMRLGSDRILPVDVRVIAATHDDLRTLVQEGKFRQDLYYRINILNLYLPPLRERRKDIPVYAQTFIDECVAAGRRVTLSAGALRYLERLDWAGNVRELRNMMERIVAMSKRETISAGHIRALLDDAVPRPAAEKRSPRAIREEKELREALAAGEGDLDKTAGILGVSRVTLWRRMSRYAIDRREWRC